MGNECDFTGGCLTRRDFLLAGGGGTMTVLLTTLPGFKNALAVPAWVTTYPRKHVASLGEVHQDVPIYFKYPDEDPLSAASFLVKLGVPAGGGVGPNDDIVAFNALCTHMGGPLMGTYKKEHKAIGPCPLHLTTFDLIKHGMVIAGHATESLPQVLLEVSGDEIYATGMLGLIYGRARNLAG